MQIDLSRFKAACGCGKEHQIKVEMIAIEKNAVRHLKDILKNYQCPVIICDNHTKAASRAAMQQYYDCCQTVTLSGDNIHANEIYAAQADQNIDVQADVLIAAGSGTIHDITRYVAFTRKIPFISVPTAASVDGFVSTVAAMTWKGMKKTMEAVAPVCVLADTNIFAKAPYRLTASGISDLLAKYIALADWKIAHILTGEYFCQTVYDLEMEAVREVEKLLENLKEGDEQSCEKLMYALLLSGLAMQMVGTSRPASGAEHHVSHFWEMNVINENVDALHGEKVSVGLLFCLERYQEILAAINAGTVKIVDNRAPEVALLKEIFGKKGLYEGLVKENSMGLLENIPPEQLTAVLPRIAGILKELPEAEEMRAKLAKAGCVVSMAQIGLPEDIKEVTLQLCTYVRNRLTLLRLSKMMEY